MRKTVAKKATPPKRTKKEELESLNVSFHYDGDKLSVYTLSRWSGIEIERVKKLLEENPTKFFLVRKNETHPEMSLWSNKKDK